MIYFDKIGNLKTIFMITNEPKYTYTNKMPVILAINVFFLNEFNNEIEKQVLEVHHIRHDERDYREELVCFVNNIVSP